MKTTVFLEHTTSLGSNVPLRAACAVGNSIYMYKYIFFNFIFISVCVCILVYVCLCVINIIYNIHDVNMNVCMYVCGATFIFIYIFL